MIIKTVQTLVFEYPEDYQAEVEWNKKRDGDWVHQSTDTMCSVYTITNNYLIPTKAKHSFLDNPYFEAEPSNSEKPNNCEVKNYCDDCLYTDTCDSKEFFYACTSKATISKMEQVDEPQTCYTCEYEWRDGTDEPCVYCYGGSKYKPKDEPQTHDIRTNTHECVKDTHDKDEPRKEQNFCGKCRYLYRDFKYGLSCYRLMDNEPCKYEERKDEPQTCSVNGRPYDCGNCEYHKCTADEPQTEREGE